MGEPHSGEENTAVSSPAEDAENGQDRPQALSDNGQSVLDHLHATPEDQSNIPRIPREEGNAEKLTPRLKRFSDKVPENHTNSINGGAGGVGVSVTLLTLDAELEPRSYSRQHFLPSPRSTDRDPEMSDLKLIRDFQVRRKYGRRPPHVHGGRQANNKNGNRNVVELGLSGTRYFTNGDSSAPSHSSHSAASSSLDGSRTVKIPLLAEESGRLPNSTPASSTVVSKLRTEEDRVSLDSTAKDLQSPVPSFPPLSPGGPPRPAVRSENSFYVSSRQNGQSPSLLSNHFGFSTIRPDTFSGMQRNRRMRLNGASDDDLLKELEQNAHKQILACQNMGFTHRGSRAAESVLSLKHTVSPSAFHPSSFFTRHVPREERTPGGGSRSGTPPGEAGAEERGRRRVTPAGKLSMPRLVVPDRQEKATRRTTLPTVCGSSLQVILAGQSHGK